MRRAQPSLFDEPTLVERLEVQVGYPLVNVLLVFLVGIVFGLILYAILWH